MERIGIIDLGSNALRMNIIEIANDGSFRLISEMSETVRLSEKIESDNLLKAEAMERTIAIIKLFKGIIKSFGVMTVLAVATAAARRATNGGHFIDLIYEETGIQFQIITGEREADLGLLAVFNTIDKENGYVLDVGGASTEVTLFRSKKRIESVSLPFGAVTLSEKFGIFGGVEMENYIKEELKDISWLKASNEKTIIGVGGTAKVLGDMVRARIDYSMNSSYNMNVDWTQISSICSELKTKSIDERSQMKGLPKDRADVILAGAIIVKELIKTIEGHSFLICNNGIRGGLFYEYYMERYELLTIENICRFSVDNLAKIYKINTHHSRHVERMALGIYKSLHELGGFVEPGLEMLLSLGAQLHDAGIVIDFENREMHTYYLIINSNIFGISHRELAMVAIIAAKLPKERIGDFILKHTDLLSFDDKTTLVTLTSILEMADRLDRSKEQLIKELKISRNGDIMVFEILNTGDPSLEIAEANRFVPELEEVFNTRLIVV